MSIQDDLSTVNKYLMRDLTSEEPTYIAFQRIAHSWQITQDELNNLKNIDEIAGNYKEVLELIVDYGCIGENARDMIKIAMKVLENEKDKYRDNN